MPIYEYLCAKCNRVYSFLAKSAAEAKAPTCPKCQSTDLKKMVSKFSFVGGKRKSREQAAPEDPGGDGPDPLDDPRIEREVMKLMDDAEGMDEDDPRQLGRLMRRMSEITGEGLGPEMEEAMRRLEAGEDPEKIEAEMGDLLEDEEDAGPGRAAPSYDDGLYPM